MLDGLLLAGGADVDPARYGQATHPETAGLRPERDGAELELLDLAPGARPARARDLPGDAADGRARRRSPASSTCPKSSATSGTARPSASTATTPVRLARGSRARLVLGDRVTVRSYHHQGVADAGSLAVTGWADDETVEVVERHRPAVRPGRAVAPRGRRRPPALRRAGGGHPGLSPPATRQPSHRPDPVGGNGTASGIVEGARKLNAQAPHSPQEHTVSLPPLVEPAAELTVDEVRRYSRHLIIPDVGDGRAEAAEERQGAVRRRRRPGSPGADVPRRGRCRHARHRRVRHRRRVEPAAPDHPRPDRRRPLQGASRRATRSARSTRSSTWSSTRSGSTPTT